MIQELFLALNGWVGDLFTEKVLPNGHILISVNEDSPHFEALGFNHSLLKGDLTCAIGAVAMIRRFINTHNDFEDKPYGQSIYIRQLALALSDFLHHTYEPLFVEMEKRYLSNSAVEITPLSLNASVFPYIDCLRKFVTVLDNVNDGVPVLNSLWSIYCKSDTGVKSASTSAVERLFSIVVLPFLNQLDEWLMKGELSMDRDPYGEFFLECVSDSEENSAFAIKRWELRAERLPSFMSITLANEILAVGELRRELSKRCFNFALIGELKKQPEIMPFGDKLCQAISFSVTKYKRLANLEMAIELVRAGALKLIGQCCELSFMNRGELFSTWLLSPSVNHVLHSTSVEDISNKSSLVLSSELKVAAQRLYTTSKHEAFNISLDDLHFEIDKSNPNESSKFKIFLFPVVTIPRGLTRVFPTESVQQYKNCFNYLVFLRMASSALHAAWLKLITSKRSFKGRHQQQWVNETRAEFSQMARMSHALSALQAHAFHVIRIHWEDFLMVARVFEAPLALDEIEFEDQLQTMKHYDCDTFILAHAKMISKISYELVRPSQSNQLRQSLVSCVLRATNGSPEKLHHTEFDKFAPLLNLLLRQQTLIAGKSSQSPIQNLLLALDFNDFYGNQ